MSVVLGARFDWYEITLDGADDGREVSKLSAALGASGVRGKPRNGYAEAWNLDRGDDTVATVYGKSPRAGEIHITTTSQACDEVVPVLRRLWPTHRVSRADSSVDFAADFDVLDVAALAFATDKGLSHRLVTDSAGGATRYLGAPSSELRVRVYKKTEQLRALHPDRADEVEDGIVRVELQARPSKRAGKERASTMTADDLWGLGKWTRALAASMLRIDVEHVGTQFRRPSDWHRAKHYLGIQYGRMVRERADEVGYEAAMAELVDVFGLTPVVGETNR